MPCSQIADMLFGALVADAASLGLHWIYDVDRIAEITASQDGKCAFTPVDAKNYEDVPSYFAHAGRLNGMLTQYGEVLYLAIRSMNACDGKFDSTSYKESFANHFGPGGAYQGYIDRPTRGALENIANDKDPSGIDDDQNPAVSTLPAIFAGYHDDPALSKVLMQCMQVTNINDTAAAYGAAYSDLLARIMQGEPLDKALLSTANAAETPIRDELLDALNTTDGSSIDYAGTVGRACHLPTAGPVVFHILKHSDSYREAIERNILAGGDSAGRSIMIGAAMGMKHGIETEKGIPLSWALKLHSASDIWEDCQRLAQFA